MFSNQKSLILERHAPDVMNDLFGSINGLKHSEKEVFIPRSQIFRNIIFPPYDFAFSVEFDSSGKAYFYDDLPPDVMLIFQNYDFNGIDFKASTESWAAAICFLALTNRRVIGRPSFNMNDISNYSIFEGAEENLTSTSGIEINISGVICGREFIFFPSNDKIKIFHFPNSTDHFILKCGKIKILPDGKYFLIVVGAVPNFIFIKFKSLILESIHRQI